MDIQIYVVYFETEGIDLNGFCFYSSAGALIFVKDSQPDNVTMTRRHLSI